MTNCCLSLFRRHRFDRVVERVRLAGEHFLRDHLPEIAGDPVPVGEQALRPFAVGGLGVAFDQVLEHAFPMRRGEALPDDAVGVGAADWPAEPRSRIVTWPSASLLIPKRRVISLDRRVPTARCVLRTE
ncbi:hypothetical protein WR25_10462 [Diploscapter pachys]|uniref:Uncharacterized protein n=1 Tax=Diploscapter pachys TaxID=2018661 RepID=A0A2A2K7E8_9BILA|nr:hypothetical protein WR25_10462 [Diploscapter pachys]